jgi:enoyl-CoA hydratase/carnithine racemase
MNEQERVAANMHGFGSISRRHTSSKPMIAAVNGGAYGGGVEMVLNCDIVIASQDAKFALPEVKRGVVAIQGGTSTRCFFWCPSP